MYKRQIMHAAARQRSLPKGLNDALMTVHAKHPFPDTPDEIAATAAQAVSYTHLTLPTSDLV